jgi:dTDP-4-dehydrorhamnose 3,5-epimerase
VFDLKPSGLDGCFELQPKVFDDDRGRFVKIFHESEFKTLGLEMTFREEYYSVSHKNVIRGLHFQLPPMDHCKLVCCVSGEALDAVVDLRVGSPTYGQYALFEISDTKANCIYIPKGMAHGFCAMSERVTMLYKVTTVYSQAHDTGILWDSAGIPWPRNNVIVSSRDRRFSALDQFVSPFHFDQAHAQKRNNVKINNNWQK